MKSKIITLQVKDPSTFDVMSEPYLRRQIENGYTFKIEQKAPRRDWIDAILSHA